MLTTDPNKLPPFKVCLDLTVYLPQPPLAAEVRAAWQIYRSICPVDQLGWIKSVRADFWDEHVDLRAENAIDPFLREQDKRLDAGVIIRNRGIEQTWSFEMRGMYPEDIGARECASLCRMVIPVEASPALLIKAAIGLTDCLDFLSGHAGYSTDYDAWRKAEAFDQIYALARRFLGLDVQDLNGTLPNVLTAIKGANWLTLIGRRLSEAHALVEQHEASLSSEIAVLHGRFASVIRAGDHPTMGDRNRGDFPINYAEVESVLWPVKLTQHQEFAGRFQELKATMPWFHRLREPANW